MLSNVDRKVGRAVARRAVLGRVVAALLASGIVAPAVLGEEPAPPPKKAPPTYAKDVAPILQKRCQNCHRSHQIGPFALDTYEQARKRAADIAVVAGARMMPPWKPAPGVGPGLKHDQSLTAEEIGILEAWAEAGAPLGDPADMPPPARFPADWKLGPPDLILEPDEDFTIPATGPDLYRCFVIPTNLAHETYLSAIDFRPGNRRVVHHITAYIDTSGAGRKRDAADPGPGYLSYSGPGIRSFQELCFWNAGHEPSLLPSGVGLRLPAQTDLIVQVHYHPSGKKEVDRTRVGVYFSREKVKRALHWNSASNFEFRLPPGESEIEVVGTWFVPTDLEALAVSPHMHMLGRDMRMSIVYADGRTRDLIHIPEWDPSWQNMYFFEKSIPLPKGAVVKVVAHFDNSDHSRNPNSPPRPVRWGHGVSDEMCDGFIAVVKKDQDLIKHPGIDELTELFAKQRLINYKKQFLRQPR